MQNKDKVKKSNGLTLEQELEQARKQLSEIVGSDFKVRIESPKIDTDDKSETLQAFGPTLRVNVPSLDVTQMGQLYALYDETLHVSNIKIKRSGVGLLIVVIFR